jgi:hypothetical protein
MPVRITWALCNPCPACGYWNGKPVERLADLNLVECMGCGLRLSFPEQPAEAKASAGHPVLSTGHHTGPADKLPA